MSAVCSFFLSLKKLKVIPIIGKFAKIYPIKVFVTMNITIKCTK